MTRKVPLQPTFDAIVEGKNQKVADLIRRAVENRVQVDLFASSYTGMVLAREYIANLGIPAGACEYVHVVCPGESPTRRSLRIPFETTHA